MKIALLELTPLIIVTINSVFGTVLLYLYFKLKKITFHLTKQELKVSIVISLLGYALPFLLQSMALEFLQTVWVGMIIALTPVLTLCWSKCLLRGYRLKWQKVVGILLGFIGFLIFLFSQQGECPEQDANHWLGIGCAVLSPLSLSFALVFAQKNQHLVKKEISAFYNLFLASLYLAPITLMFESLITFDWLASTWQAILIMVVPCTTIAYLFYFKLIRSTSAVYISMINYLLPIFKTLLGVLILHEVLTVSFYLSSFFILVGILIVNGSHIISSSERLIKFS